MKIKPILRFDPGQKLVRIARITRIVGTPGDGKGYSTKTTIALTPRLFGFGRSWDAWFLILAGIRIRHVVSFGGIFA